MSLTKFKKWISLKPIKKNLLYITDSLNMYKCPIDTGTDLSIFKSKICEEFRDGFPENVIIREIDDMKILIAE